MEVNKTHGAPSWVEYNGTGSAAARKFYTDVLDWTVADMPMADGNNYPGIMVDGKPIGGFNQRPQEHSGWVVYITVDDVDARFKKAVDAGATAHMEPFDAPGVGRMCHISDPTGAVVALIKYAE